MRIAFVGFWASLIVKTMMNEIAICLEQFLPSFTTSTLLPTLLVIAVLF
jgi:hypothetical protein